MYLQIMKSKENKSREISNLSTQKKSNIHHQITFSVSRLRPVAQRKFKKMASGSLATEWSKIILKNDNDVGQRDSDITQCMPIVQLATRLSTAVQFQGGADNLRNLIYQWNHLPGIQVQVIPTDYVGGTYRVRFTRNEGAISLAQANIWVQNALNHAQNDESSDSDEN